MSIAFWMVLAFGAIPMIIFGIIMMFGYGKELLAGYNTASDEERSKYNEKRLLRVSGLTVFSVGILLIITFYLYDLRFFGVAYAIIIPFLPMLIGIPLMNSKFCKKE